MGSFYPKHKMQGLENYRGVRYPDNDANFEEELTCRLKIDMRNLGNFDPSTQKFQKFAF